ncbi:glycosyltransferase family 4 protein [Chamaesiphon sp. VAR_48_metabat_135_sub]|uniref:glycosyltransferase family 4 protein n=1 Tax=Chamaesiphon sp. VAR_48_metabat_135_sub TaxID=2964699 RepID=UPI00286AEFC5|nr:glycosyltransferase family 4 protein [Chamaesiphon sp. VAR_48_metabat_135_sub]
MRCTLIIHSLSSGGAERVLSRMANYWAEKGWEITLLNFTDESETPFYHLDDRVNHRQLGIAEASANPMAGILNNVTSVRGLRAAIIQSKPDAVISFMDRTNVIAILATRWLKIPILVSERNDPAMLSAGKMWELLRQWTYPFADRIVVQTERAGSYFAKLQKLVFIMPNPVILPPTETTGSAPLLGANSLIAVGRLVSQKGFDLLLRALAQVKDRYPEWTLTILGEGELRPELEALRQELGLEDRVHLPGRVKNPHEFLKQADIFIMSSRFEGFPNALCEAMVCGLPVISTDCPNGPREIIRDGVDGILVPTQDVPALAAAMERLMSDYQLRQSLAKAAPEVAERFSLDKVMLMWESLVKQVIAEK